MSGEGIGGNGGRIEGRKGSRRKSTREGNLALTAISKSRRLYV